MPSIEKSNSDFIQEAKEYLRQAPNSLYPEHIQEREAGLRDIAIYYGIELLGVGRTRFVFVMPDHPDKVFAVHRNHRFPLEAKIDYYLQNIYSAVWPYNFPRAFFSSGSPSYLGDEPAGNINQIIKGEASRRVGAHRIISGFLETAETDQDVKYPFSKVVSDCEYWNIPLYIDRVLQNFVLGEDGGEYYLDAIQSIGTFENYDSSSLRNITKMLTSRRNEPPTRSGIHSMIERAYVLNERRLHVMGLK